MLDPVFVIPIHSPTIVIILIVVAMIVFELIFFPRRMKDFKVRHFVTAKVPMDMDKFLRPIEYTDTVSDDVKEYSFNKTFNSYAEAKKAVEVESRSKPYDYEIYVLEGVYSRTPELKKVN